MCKFGTDSLGLQAAAARLQHKQAWLAVYGGLDRRKVGQPAGLDSLLDKPGQGRYWDVQLLLVSLPRQVAITLVPSAGRQWAFSEQHRRLDGRQLAFAADT